MISFTIAVTLPGENDAGLNGLVNIFPGVKGEGDFEWAKLLVMEVRVFCFLTTGIFDTCLLSPKDSTLPGVVGMRPFIFANELAVGASNRDEDGTCSFSETFARKLPMVDPPVNDPGAPIDDALPSVIGVLRPMLLTSGKDVFPPEVAGVVAFPA